MSLSKLEVTLTHAFPSYTGPTVNSTTATSSTLSQQSKRIWHLGPNATYNTSARLKSSMLTPLSGSLFIVT